MTCTANDTTTTRSEMRKPWTIGRNPDLDTSLKLVLSPIAPRAMIIENLEMLDRVLLRLFEMSPIDLSPTMTRKRRMNHGKIFLRSTLGFSCVCVLPVCLSASFAFFFSLM